MPDVSLVIPNLDIKLLTWFLKTNWPVLRSNVFKNKLELIVVSSSQDKEALEALKKRYPKVKFRDLNTEFSTHLTKFSTSFAQENDSRGETFGFAKTVNLGFKQASSTVKWLGTVNDDVVLTKGWLDNLIRTGKQFKNVGSVNPVITNNLNFSGFSTHLTQFGTSFAQENDSNEVVIESAGIKVLPIGRAVPIAQMPKKPTLVDATNAACVIYSAQALKKVGFFNEKFESYLEDIDLSLRLAKQGYVNIVVPSVIVYHLKHTTSKKTLTEKKRAWLNLRNWWYVLFKNWDLSTWIKYLPGILVERARNFSGWIKA